MHDLDLDPRADGVASGGVDRRTLPVRAAGGLAAAGLSASIPSIASIFQWSGRSGGC
jgi:hypothetical protein